MYRNPANSAFQQKLELGLMLSLAMRSVQFMLHLIVAIRTRGYKFIFLDHYLLSNCNIMIQLTWFYLGNMTKKSQIQTWEHFVRGGGGGAGKMFPIPNEKCVLL